MEIFLCDICKKRIKDSDWVDLMISAGMTACSDRRRICYECRDIILAEIEKLTKELTYPE